MYADKRTPRLPDPFSAVALYVDLSKATMKNRRQLAIITKALQNLKFLCKWFSHYNKTHIVRTLPACLKLLWHGHIIPEEVPNPSDHLSAHMETGGAYQDA